MGPRLLERWLRQPLVDVAAINARLDLVELLRDNTVLRNALMEGPLKGVPDLDTIIGRMQKKKAGLAEILRLYMFARAIPGCVDTLTDLVQPEPEEEASGPDRDRKDAQRGLLKAKFLDPLEKIVGKFKLFCAMTETVIDFSALPDLLVSARHSPLLQELAGQRADIVSGIERLHQRAMSSWGNGDLKLGICIYPYKPHYTLHLIQTIATCNNMRPLLSAVYLSTCLRRCHITH